MLCLFKELFGNAGLRGLIMSGLRLMLLVLAVLERRHAALVRGGGEARRRLLHAACLAALHGCDARRRCPLHV